MSSSPVSPDDAVLLGVMTLAQSQNPVMGTQPVGSEWLRLKEYYSPPSPNVSAAEAEHWLTLFLRFVRQAELSTERRVPVLHAISDAIRAVRCETVEVCRNDLLRWTQMSGWAAATGMLFETKHAYHAAGIDSGITPGSPGGVNPAAALLLDSGLYPAGVVAATQALQHAATSNLALGDVRAVYREWLNAAADCLTVPPVLLHWDASASDFGGGYYKPFSMEIVLSVVDDEVLLHEFRHHLQYAGALMVSEDLEVDARAWARGLLDVISR